MSDLYRNFLGYLHLYLPKTKWIILLGCVFFSLFWIIQKKSDVKRHRSSLVTFFCMMLLSLECSFIFVMTLFGRTIGEAYKLPIGFFDSYFAAFAEGNVEVLLQILMNIVMFIPLGFLLPCCFSAYKKYRYVLLTTVICSFGIELLQMILKIGWFELDDIVDNVLGAGIGVSIYMLFTKLIKKFWQQNLDS